MSDKPQKCFFDLRGYAVDRYRLPSDGRKCLKQCRERRALAIELAGYANPDGSNITVGVKELARVLGMAESTVRVYLNDLNKLGLLINEEQQRRGPRKRRINVRAFQASGIEKEASGIEDLDRRDSPAMPPGLESKTAGIEIKSSGIGGKTSGIDISGIRVKAVDSEFTADLKTPTALPTPTPTNNRPTEVVVVGGLDEKATIDGIIRKIKNYFAIKFEEEVLIENLDAVAALAGIHGENVLEAWKLYLRDWTFDFTGDNKTKFPVRFFVKTFDSWLAKVEQGIRAIDRQPTTKENIEATNKLALEAWHKSHPGWQRNEQGDLVKVDEEPDPEALFADETT